MPTSYKFVVPTGHFYSSLNDDSKKVVHRGIVKSYPLNFEYLYNISESNRIFATIKFFKRFLYFFIIKRIKNNNRIIKIIYLVLRHNWCKATLQYPIFLYKMEDCIQPAVHLSQPSQPYLLY